MGMPVGSDLEYVDEVTMDKALSESARDVVGGGGGTGRGWR